LENLELSTSFWRDKRVLITGHTGFKGGWLSIWLQRLGANVAGYALPPTTAPNLFELANVANNMRSELGNIQNLEQVSEFVSDFQPQVIIHMAAQSLVRPSYADPVETFASNVMGTVNILEAARHCESVRAIVNVTTDKCYENLERADGYREDEPLGGHDPYSGSKGCAEIVTSSYRRSFSLPVASARAGNVIGGGDWAEDRLLPDMMRSFMSGEVVSIRNPASTRPWQHVLEPLHGYLKLAEHVYDDSAAFADAWNFGPDDDDAKPVEWLADRVSELWGESASWSNEADSRQPHEAGFLRLNCEKAKQGLNWRPRLNLDSALGWTVDWYKSYQGGDDIRELTEHQISNYENGKGLI
jgi:CDP-glucose 4,6-dehydratase